MMRANRLDPQARRPWGALLVGTLACAGLVGGFVSPAWGAEPGGGGETPVVGAFGLGDGLEASIDERDGSLQFAASAGGLRLVWNSRAAGSGRDDGFGPLWGLERDAVKLLNALEKNTNTTADNLKALEQQTPAVGKSLRTANDAAKKFVADWKPALTQKQEGLIRSFDDYGEAFTSEIHALRLLGADATKAAKEAKLSYSLQTWVGGSFSAITDLKSYPHLKKAMDPYLKTLRSKKAATTVANG